MLIKEQELIVPPPIALVGAFQRWPMRDYLKAPGISKHALDYLHESPRKFRDYLDGNWRPKQTEAMEFGRILHSLVLEGRTEYVVQPETYENDEGEAKPWNNRSNTCRAWTIMQAHTIVSRTKATEIEQLADAVQNETLAIDLLADGNAEVSMFADDEDGLRLKGRPDWSGSDYFVDVKTTTDCSLDEFSKEIYSRRYHVQAAHYLRIAKLLGMPQTKWFFIILQKGDRLDVNVRQLHDEALRLGNCELKDDLALLKECQKAGNWYGHSGKSGKIEKIDVPPWAHSKYAEKLLSGLALAGEKLFA